MDFIELKENISNLYRDFFIDMKINPQTGIVEGTNRRFSGYPYIGANYVNAPIKILFIPLDTGKDECFEENTFHSFENRESIFPTGMLNFNAHIAGVYATALYVLKEKMGYQGAWDSLWNNRVFKSAKAIRKSYDSLPKDLMSYIAYENRFRFVTIGRGWKLDNYIIAEDGTVTKKKQEKTEKDSIKERGGSKDRVWINPQREAQLLMDEIDVFAPDIIVFQGTTDLWNCHINELEKKYKVVIAYHPSYYKGGADKLQYIVEKIGPQLL